MIALECGRGGVSQYGGSIRSFVVGNSVSCFRSQKLEEEFEQQLMEQEQFYGAYLNNSSTTLMSAVGPDASK